MTEQRTLYVTVRSGVLSWQAEPHAPTPAHGAWRAEVSGYEQWERYDFPALTVWVLVRGEWDLDAMAALATAYADGSLPRVAVDLSLFDLDRKTAREWKAANKAQAVETRKAERKQRFVYDEQIPLEGE